MKTKFNPYKWTKDRINLLYKNVEHLSDLEVTTSKHDVWSIKKLIALDYYIVPFVKILLSNGFKKWYYVDPFSGSGLLKIKNKYLFPSSSFIPLFRINEFPFSRYYLSDNNKKYIDVLEKRVEAILKSKGANVQVSVHQKCK